MLLLVFYKMYFLSSKVHLALAKVPCRKGGNLGCGDVSGWGPGGVLAWCWGTEAASGVEGAGAPPGSAGAGAAFTGRVTAPTGLP